jgi:hypothetical protein
MESSDALLARLRESGCDACVLRIGEGDYGCEEPPRDPPVWLLVLTREGEKLSRELPESRLRELELKEGALCRLADLHR